MPRSKEGDVLTEQCATINELFGDKVCGASFGISQTVNGIVGKNDDPYTKVSNIMTGVNASITAQLLKNSISFCSCYML